MFAEARYNLSRMALRAFRTGRFGDARDPSPSSHRHACCRLDRDHLRRRGAEFERPVAGLSSFDRGIGKVVGEWSECLPHLFRMSVAPHAFEQFVVQTLVGQENGACRLHSRDRRLDISRRGKEELL
jgi:hypothetical protein